VLRYSSILLAAGISRRMGATNKLLLEIDGLPMVRHCAERLIEVTGGATTVVLGHDADKIAASLNGLTVHMIKNPDYAAGQMASVTVGLRLSCWSDFTLIALADQPRLTSQMISELFSASQQPEANEKIIIPMRSKERGNPIVVPALIRERIIREGTNLGCQGLLRKHPELIYPYHSDQEGYFVDLDTPEAYTAEINKNSLIS
jgi:molybdenum cofactor cytidylyltransferase